MSYKQYTITTNHILNLTNCLYTFYIPKYIKKKM